MKYSGQKVWGDILSTFKNQVSASTYKTWFSGAYLVGNKTIGDKDVLIVGVRNNFLKEQIETRYLPNILEILQQKGLENTEVVFIVASRDNSSRVAPIGPLFSGAPLEYIGERGRGDGLSPSSVFNSFVVGNSNNLAYLAAAQVAQNIGGVYNPLFIYGQVGVGKTHLMQAVGNDVLARLANAKVLYVTSEKFTNEYIESLNNKTSSSFRHKYRSLDLLLVDDVQFLAGKEGTQDEFFHTFNELYLQGKQVVLASDRHPRELGKLKERLVSRFLGGMAVDIGIPDLEMKVAILQSKCKARGVSLDSEILTYIAGSCGGSVRELEGILISTLAQIKIVGNNLGFDEIKKNIEKNKQVIQKPTVSKIFEIISRHLKIDPLLIKGQSRKADIVLARQLVMFFLRKELGIGLESIGELLGGRDHSTVIHGIEKVEKKVLVNNLFKDDILRVQGLFYK